MDISQAAAFADYPSTDMRTEVTPIYEQTEYELERGKPMPSFNHSELELNISLAFAPYRKQFSIKPELSLELTTGKATPDVCIFPKTPVDWRKDIVKYKQPPLLTVEILSPKQILDDLVDKVYTIYLPAGVKASWVVLPILQTIYVFTPDGEQRVYTTGSFIDPATGIEISVDEIFDKGI